MSSKLVTCLKFLPVRADGLLYLRPADRGDLLHCWDFRKVR